MPRTHWIDPLDDRERVPLDFYDTDTRCHGRPAVSPAMIRMILDYEITDERHARLDPTVTRILGCPRETFLERLFPYHEEPKKAWARTRGSHGHAGLDNRWPKERYVTEVELAGTVFGVHLTGRADVIEFDRPSNRFRIVDLGDNKFGNDTSVKWRSRPSGQGEYKLIGKTKTDHALQLNILRLLMEDTVKNWEGWEYDPNTVRLTIWDYASAGDDGPVPLAAPHYTEQEMLLMKPGVFAPGETGHKPNIYAQAATLYEILVDYCEGVNAYAALPEGVREQAGAVEGVVSKMRLIGQRGQLGGKKCTTYCPVSEVCGMLTRKYGGRVA
jgi:hypothetical protein